MERMLTRMAARSRRGPLQAGPGEEVGFGLVAGHSTPKKPKRTAASTPSDSEISKSEPTSDSNPSVQPKSEPVSAPAANEVSVVDVAPRPATLTVSTAQDVPQVESAPESEVKPLASTLLSAVGLSPSADGDIPEVPGDSPLLLAGLAALRRQTQQALTGDEALA